jgi:hypothetical protein
MGSWIVRFAPCKCASVGFWDLPRPLRAKLGLYLPCPPGTRIGPIGTAFGIWLFEAQENRPGGAPLSLAQAKPLLLCIIHGNEFANEESDASLPERAFRAAENRDQSLLNALAYEVLPENPAEPYEWEAWAR